MTMSQTDSPVCPDWPSLTGRQEPEHLRFVEGDASRGDSAVELARRVGSKPMPWQESMVRYMSMTDEDGRWCHSDCVLVCPRQNGKSEIMAIIVLYRIFVLRHTVIFTAQQWKTAEDLYKRTFAMVKARKFLLKRVEKTRCSQGRGEIFLRDGGGVTFTTRSQDAGRGLSKIDLVIYDEAYNLTEGETAALNPTQLAADDPQTIYTSSAVNKFKHANGELLSALRRDGLEGTDPSLFFAEFMAPDGADRLEPETWRLANPSFGAIMNEGKVAKLMRGMSTEDGRIAFDVEALGRGEWFEDLLEDEFKPVLSPEVVEKAFVDDPELSDHMVFAVDASPDGAFLSIAGGVKSKAGVHGSVGFHGAFDTDECVAWLKASVEKNDPAAVIVDPKSAANTLIIPLERAGVKVTTVNFSQAQQAYGSFLSRVTERKWTLDRDADVVESLGYAQARVMQSGSMWDRYSGDVTVLCALSFAMWGCEAFEPKRRPRQKVTVGSVDSAQVSSWQMLSF